MLWNEHQFNRSHMRDSHSDRLFLTFLPHSSISILTAPLSPLCFFICSICSGVYSGAGYISLAFLSRLGYTYINNLRFRSIIDTKYVCCFEAHIKLTASDVTVTGNYFSSFLSFLFCKEDVRTDGCVAQ